MAALTHARWRDCSMVFLVKMSREASSSVRTARSCTFSAAQIHHTTIRVPRPLLTKNSKTFPGLSSSPPTFKYNLDKQQLLAVRSA